MKYIVDIKKCRYLGEGHEGAVYLTPEGYALKIFFKENKSRREAALFKKVKSSRFFPKIILVSKNMIVREYAAGMNLREYIKEHGLSYKLSCEIIDMIEDFKRLKFTRLNIRNAHIFVDENENIKLIDPRKIYEKDTPYPKDIVKILVSLNLYDAFLKNTALYRPDLLNYYSKAYDYFVFMTKKTIKIEMKVSKIS